MSPARYAVPKLLLSSMGWSLARTHGNETGSGSSSSVGVLGGSVAYCSRGYLTVSRSRCHQGTRIDSASHYGR